MPPKKSRPKSRSKSAVEADRQAKIQEEEKIRLEKEAAHAELERKAAVVENLLERRNGERLFVQQLCQKRADDRAERDKSVADKLEWERYIACPTLPNADDHAGVNTFFTTMDETEVPRDFDLETEMASLDQAVVLLETLNDRADYLGARSNHDEAKSCDQLARLAYQSIISKIESITEMLLQYADERALPNQDLQIFSLATAVKMFVWGNLNKDPMLEMAEFKPVKEEVETDEDDEFAGNNKAAEEEEEEAPPLGSVSVSKPLRVAPIAIRLVALPFDPFTNASRLTVPLIDLEPEDPEGFEIIVPVVPDDTIAEEDENQEGKKEEAVEAANTNGAEDKVAQKDAVDGKEGDGADVPLKETESAADGVAETPDVDGDGKEAPLEQPSEEEKKEEAKLPENVVDLDVYEPIGRVLLFDMLTLPAPQIVCKRWTIREVVASDILREKIPYPFADAPKVPDPTNPDNSIPAQAGIAPWDPIAMSIPMWEGLVNVSELKLAWWDAAVGMWKSDGFSDVVLVEETSMLSFKTNHLAPTTLIQRKDLRLTLKDWEVTPVDEDTVSLTTKGVDGDYVFHITSKGVQLQTPVFTQVPKLNKEWLPVQRFIDEMLRAKVNCFPGLQSAEGKKNSAPISEKDLALEMSAYRQISMLSPVCIFRESVWNKGAGDQQICMLMKDASNPDDSWTVMLVDGYKGAFVPETFEHSDELSNESHRDVQMHGTLHHAISAKIGNPRMEKATSLASSTSYALSYLLAAIRPFSFSLADKAAEFQATERVRVAEEEAKRKEEEEKLAAEAAVIEEARIAAELAANPPKKKKK